MNGKLVAFLVALLFLSVVVGVNMTGQVTSVPSENGNDAEGEAILIDARTYEEHVELRIPDSELMPYDSIGRHVQGIDRDEEIRVYCRTGRRSAIAKRTLEEMGYTNVVDIGGIQSWEGETVTSLGCPGVDYQEVQDISTVAC